MMKNILEECGTSCDLRSCGSSGNPLKTYRSHFQASGVQKKNYATSVTVIRLFIK
jgi:hypothetical protein